MGLSFHPLTILPALCLSAGITTAALCVVKGKLHPHACLLAALTVFAMIPPAALLLPLCLRSADSAVFAQTLLFPAFTLIAPMTALFFRMVLRLKRLWPAAALLPVSLCFSAAAFAEHFPVHAALLTKYTQTRYLYPAFGALLLAVSIYLCILSIVRSVSSKNTILRAKSSWLLLSALLMSITASLIFLPHISPYYICSLSFLPLLPACAAVLLERFPSPADSAKKTFAAIVCAAIFILPNAALFYFIEPALHTMPKTLTAEMLAIWLAADIALLFALGKTVRAVTKRKAGSAAAEDDLIEEILAASETSDLLPRITAVAAKALSVASADIYLRDEESGAYTSAGGKRIELPEELGRRFTAAVIEADRAELDRVPAASHGELAAFFAATESASAAALLYNGRITGLLCFGAKKGRNLFTENEIRFIHRLRLAAGVSVQNSLRYTALIIEKDELAAAKNSLQSGLSRAEETLAAGLDVAGKIQRAMLPESLPQGIPDIAATSFRKGAISSDAWKVLKLNDRVFAAVVIDFPGHSIPAAILSAIIIPEVEAQIHARVRTGEICTALNAKLCQSLKATGFRFTMFLCLVDLQTKIMEFTNCGHTETILYSGDKFMKLDSDGVAIGNAAETGYECRRIQLSGGDRVFLYTDGLTSAEGPDGKHYGETKFMKMIALTHLLPVREQVEAVISSVDEFRGKDAGAEKDDMTLLAFSVE